MSRGIDTGPCRYVCGRRRGKALTTRRTDEYEHHHCRVVAKMAWGMLAGLKERAGEFQLVMGLELLVRSFSALGARN